MGAVGCPGYDRGVTEGLDDVVAGSGGEEVVDGLPVLHAPAGAAAAIGPRGLPPAAVQAVTVAGASFVAGATVIAMLRDRRARKAARNALGLAGRRRRRQKVQVLGTRSFLVDVHVIERR